MDGAPASPDMNARSGRNANPGADPAAGVNAAGGTVVVRIPGPLRALADGREAIELPAGTVSAALEALVDRHPGLRRHLLTEDGTVRDYVNVFVNDDDIRYLDGPGTAVGAEDVITIVPSIAGG